MTEEPEGRACRVLIVDDNALSAHLVRRILEEAGVDAEIAGDAEDAIRRARLESFDVAFIDLQMGPPDGMEVLRRTRDTVPVRYVLTGYADAEEEERAMALGATGILLKPIDLEEVARLARLK